MECRDAIDRLSPFLDDELDPVASAEVASHVESCPDCAAALEQQRKLHSILERDLEYHPASDLLRARVMRDFQAAVRSGARARPAVRPWHWLGAAAAVLALASGTWLATTLAPGRADDLLAREAVSSHIRSLMPGHLTDVTSTDQHTVKPWFAGKLDYSPPVTDFAGAGYPLIGGRLDYMQDRPVAALVYAHGKHAINVFVWPAAGGGPALAPAGTRQGYHVIHGTNAGMRYWIVSDLNVPELTTFARMFAAPAARP